MASICQIGTAHFRDGTLVNENRFLINPKDYFDPINTGIHKIDESDVLSAPSFVDVYPRVCSILRGKICVSHTPFDRIALDRCVQKWALEPVDVIWLDSARVARRAWDECARTGYGLAAICRLIGFEFKHHDALDDAKACGAIVHAAIARTGLPLEGWLTRARQPISGSSSSRAGLALEGNPEGEFYGQSLVFTGSLTIPRKEAAALAASIGCSVSTSVSKKTDYLVVGDRDISRFAGKGKSSKYIRAEELRARGVPIRILTESDFRVLVGICT